MGWFSKKGKGQKAARKVEEVKRRAEVGKGPNTMKWTGYATAKRGWLSRFLGGKD